MNARVPSESTSRWCVAADPAKGAGAGKCRSTPSPRPPRARAHGFHLPTLALALARLLGGFLLVAPGLAANRPNVLLIISDDLRPQLGAYGDRVVKSPHLDRLAQSSLRFDRAYVQQAVCSPSRNSFLSGLRPSTTGLRGFGRNIRSAVPDVVTLPQHFKQQGYHAVGMGKIFHVYAETGLGSEDDPLSWSVPIWLPTKAPWGPEHEGIRQRLIAEARAAGREFKHSHEWPRGGVLEAADVPDEELRDGETAARAANFLLGRRGRPNEPFFLAVGFFQPHLPFVAPKKYFDLYAPHRLPLPDEAPPQGAPKGTFNAGMTDQFYDFPPAEKRDAAFKRRYLQAYLACISYMDACAGRALDALDGAGLRDNTIVVFLGRPRLLHGRIRQLGPQARELRDGHARAHARPRARHESRRPGNVRAGGVHRSLSDAGRAGRIARAGAA